MVLSTMRTANLCAVLFSLCLPLSAHGGQYVGPPDVVPPGAGGGGGRPGGPGPTTGSPGSPKTPGPAPAPTPGRAPTTGPTTPPPGSPGSPGSHPITGMTVETDVTSWDVWWEINKAPYLQLKDALRSRGVISGSADWFVGETRQDSGGDLLLPTEQDALDLVLPALHRAIGSTANRDIASACMIAMAKIGRDHPTFTLASVFQGRLQSHDQEIRETAAIAFGIAALPTAANIDLLVALATDSAAGRKLCGSGEVDSRTRAFAIYGLSLIANATTATAIKRGIFDALAPMLADNAATNRDIRVAIVQALGLLQPGADTPEDRQLCTDAVTALSDYFERDLGQGEQLIQAHCPNAIARLLPAGDARRAAFQGRFASVLTNKGQRRKNSIYVTQSCAQALGKLCQPCADGAAADAAHCQLLLDTWHDHKDAQTRYFALIALAQIGGGYVRGLLMSEFGKAHGALDQSWSALALGILAFDERQRRRGRSLPAVTDAGIGEALLLGFKAAKTPAALGALAVAIGLSGHVPAGDALLLQLRDERREDVIGYLCIGLALLGEPRARAPIQDLVERSTRRPDQLRQAAVALGLLGDKHAADQLVRMLGNGEGNLAQEAAISSALGFIGDRRSIQPLLQILGDERCLDLARAFAAVALGGISDKERLPWNSKIGCGANYRAATETLTNGATGILDIL